VEKHAEVILCNENSNMAEVRHFLKLSDWLR